MRMWTIQQQLSNACVQTAQLIHHAVPLCTTMTEARYGRVCLNLHM